ncbi:MAG: DNA methylase, partial [Bacteroidales bacterium]|nr:DNA methylase [Bacteroidales bacterium]
NHRPLTDFWQVGPGKARRLEKNYLFTMGDIAERSQYDEEFFYKTFGIDGEILIAHAWGMDPVMMEDIKSYKPSGHSLSNGQVLSRPYKYHEARVVFSEMIDGLCADMFHSCVVAGKFSWWVSYDWKSLEECPNYDGEVCLDFYGRLHPKHNNGTVKMPMETNSVSTIAPLLLAAFDAKTDHRLLFRRLGIAAEGVHAEDGFFQLNLFIDYEALEKEKKLQGAISEIRSRFGRNSLFTGKNLLKGATQLERSSQIGGHRA